MSQYQSDPSPCASPQVKGVRSPAGWSGGMVLVGNPASWAQGLLGLLLCRLLL